MSETPDEQAEPNESGQTAAEGGKWADPGDDDIGIRNESPEAIIDKYLRRNENG